MKPESKLPFSNCTHCGLCLPVCPTYQQSGDENNSPRGRLRLWSEEAAGRLPADPWTDFYSAQCLGCLACESACPAHVPYGQLFERTRHEQASAGRFRPRLPLRLAAALLRRGRLLDLALSPLRLWRRLGLPLHPLLPPGHPALWQDSASYAAALMQRHRPNGPRVALLTGCLTEAALREINFATLRVLIENNCQVVVPRQQVCCGAMLEHSGQDGVEALRQRNRDAFASLEVEAVLSNAAGCGFALQKTLQPEIAVRDVLSFLAELGPKRRQRAANDGRRLHVDLPCHLLHGQRQGGIAPSVLDATGLPWALAPMAAECCGSGGVYNVQQPAEARAILQRKAAFLEQAAGDPPVLATANPVCMMQWHSARSLGLVNRHFEVRHVLELLDPGPL
jgi:glycolate oxidase iron-sulfur subunit